jgi:DNA polymerase III delta prime subunit
VQYFGHEPIRAALEAADPQVSLFLGPPSCGRWTLAEWIVREKWGLPASGVFRAHRLTADNSRFIESFALTAPTGDRSAVICRTRKASLVAQNILLKTLEEAPPTTFFFLIADELPIPTITSRCHVFRFGPLSDEEVQNILIEVKRLRPETAEDRAAIARGSVVAALEYSDTKERKMLVLRVLEAFREKDPAILEGLASRWTEEHTELLAMWAQEAVTKRWRFFSEAESGFESNRVPLKILKALHANVRPRLVIRSSLMNVMLSER